MKLLFWGSFWKLNTSHSLSKKWRFIDLLQKSTQHHLDCNQRRKWEKHSWVLKSGSKCIDIHCLKIQIIDVFFCVKVNTLKIYFCQVHYIVSTENQKTYFWRLKRQKDCKKTPSSKYSFLSISIESLSHPCSMTLTLCRQEEEGQD